MASRSLRYVDFHRYSVGGSTVVIGVLADVGIYFHSLGGGTVCSCYIGRLAALCVVAERHWRVRLGIIHTAYTADARAHSVLAHSLAIRIIYTLLLPACD